MSPPKGSRAHGRAARRRRRDATVNSCDVRACAGAAGEAPEGLAVPAFAGGHGVSLRRRRLLRAPRAAPGLLLQAHLLLARLLLLRAPRVLELDADELVRDRVAVPDVEPPP